MNVNLNRIWLMEFFLRVIVVSIDENKIYILNMLELVKICNLYVILGD